MNVRAVQRVYKIKPIIVNEVRVVDLVIDPHYEKKHSGHISDALILSEDIIMGFPSTKDLKLIRARLSKAEPSFLLPKNSSKADQVKYKLCEKFVIYLTKHKMSQVQLAKALKVDPSRINEIVKYRIDLFTIDKLIDLAERVRLDFQVNVA